VSGLNVVRCGAVRPPPVLTAIRTYGSTL
jgi:hypothetical protein